MSTFLGSTATPTSAAAPVGQLFRKFRCVGHKARGLLDRVAALVSTAILALVTCDLGNAVVLHDALHDLGLPRTGVRRVLVQEVPTTIGLDPVKLDAELQVLFRSLELPRDCDWVSYLVVDPLLRRERSAHRGSH